MRKYKAYLTKTTALSVIFGIIGIVNTVVADPNGSQRLRGLGDRVFAVEVTNLAPECIDENPDNDPDDCNFTNCYGFLADGGWDDPLFFQPGTWVQHSNGASTSYTGEASESEVFAPYVIGLEQNGQVTPANGRGVLQLSALTNVNLILDGQLLVVLTTYHSVGEEIDAIEAADVCPDP